MAVGISAICSILEAALYSVPLTHIEILDKKGVGSAKALRSLKADIHRPITAILTLNTIANTMGAAVAGAAAAAVFGESRLALFSAAFTMTILIFSEILPKTIGVAYCREISPWIALPITLMVKILTPIIWFFQALTRMIPRHNNKYPASQDEVKAIAALSRKSGEIDSQEEKVIGNILELKNKYVIDVMTPRTVTFSLDENLTVAEALTHANKWNYHSRVPVYNRKPDEITGIVLRKDVLQAAAEGMDSIKISTMIHPAHFVPESARLSRTMLDFFEMKRHLFVVVDEYGSVTGVISLEDIIEEIVGHEIMDESDQTQDMRALAKKKQKKRAAENRKSGNIS
ncbi:MAG: hemolysin family protein [Proteobacteria bacterium]|nr:hemolysin family protein [Pseudomonadota bacterium]MBU1739321.1 hemolysin family protein [Pseudomonadota bacterium]